MGIKLKNNVIGYLDTNISASDIAVWLGLSGLLALSAP